MHLAELGVADRQIAITAQPLLEDLHVAGAVHRLDRIDALVRGLRREHVFAEFFPVARSLPKTAIHELGTVDLLEARGLLFLAHVADQRLEDAPALRMPEHRTGSLFLHVKQIEFAADLAVIAFLGLFETGQVIFEVLVVGPRRTVDALQHLVARVAAPIGTGYLHQLEYFELAGRGHVRAAAKIDPLALAVETDRLVRGDAGDDLGFVVLTEALEKRHGVVTRHFAARHREIGLGEFAHLGFDGDQIFGRERPLVGEVVIEAVFDHGPDGHLRIRK